jgi:site-specific DNA recombinase
MTTGTAVLYARVSSCEQQMEGYSIEAQVKLLHESAAKYGLEIIRQLIEVESAKATGRKKLTEMVSFFMRNRSCQDLYVEMTDRLTRNPRDVVTIEDLDISVHLVKEGEILSKNSRSHQKFIFDIRVAMARNYTENQKVEVGKGMVEKAVQGGLPGHAPFGYAAT